MLLERTTEIGACGRLLASTAAGTGGAIFVVGQPGTGKTSLLEAVSAMAYPDIPTRRARGAVMETDLPFAFAEQLLGAITTAGAPDPLAARSVVYDVARAALRDLAAIGPVVLLLDDLHWADPDSVALVGFLTRRLVGLPVALVAGLRSWPPSAVTLAESLSSEGVASILRLRELSESASGDLLSIL